MKPNITIEERAARVDAFHKMTQGDYDHLLRVVALVVPSRLCDPSEALSEGLLAATRMYNGEAQLATYVAKCAFNYALWRARKNRAITFTDLESEPHVEDDDSYIAETLFATVENPRYVEAVDDKFIGRIEELLDQSIDYRHRSTRPTVIALAKDVLTLLRENANLGYGIGVDEYDHAPMKAPDYRGQFRVEYNTLEPRRRIHEHLAEQFNASPENVDQAMIALRNSTRQALHEGWLP
jgi:hypothetical protein